MADEMKTAGTTQETQATEAEKAISMLGDLSRISRAMSAAPTLGTADPRFWVVQERRWRSVPADSGGAMALWSASDVSLFSPQEFAYAWFSWKLERDEEWPGEGVRKVSLGKSVEMTLKDGGDPESTWDWEVSSIDQRRMEEEVEDGITIPGYEVVWRDWEWETVENTMFLTLADCEEHIRLNSYHYDHPRAFCMSAWRSPEVEALWKALKGIDWDVVARLVQDSGADVLRADSDDRG